MTTTVYKVYYLGLAFIALVMVGWTISVGSHNVTYGKQMSQLEKQKVALEEQQSLLQKQIAQEQSLTQLADFATVQGYVPVSQVVRVQVAETVASR
jgi:cell division protein FtsL